MSGSPGLEADARPMRRDAVRNQKRVLEAARAVLAEHGTDATMELIASRAGVGIGTVYRHFPTKDVLIDELIRLIFTELITAARTSLEQEDGSGLETFLHVLGQSFTEHRGYAHLLVGRAPAECGAELLRHLIAELLEQAIDKGRIGKDVVLGDIMATIWAIRGVVETSASITPRAWQRHLDLHLGALRSGQLRSAVPAITDRQLNRIATNRRPVKP
jgi:AcrR family transcriptional regulator